MALEQAGVLDVVGSADVAVRSVGTALRSQADVIVVVATDSPPLPVVRAMTSETGTPVRCVVLGAPHQAELGGAYTVGWQATNADLWSAIVSAARGGVGVEADGAVADPGLSCREVEVLRCAAAGQTNFSTARALGLSEATVKTYWQRIFKKLAARDRTKAVATALGLGLLVESGHDTDATAPDATALDQGAAPDVRHTVRERAARVVRRSEVPWLTPVAADRVAL